MDPGKFFQIITNSTLLATKLLSGSGAVSVGFTEPRYCAILPEDAKVATVVTAVTAIHKHGETVTYTITGGNGDGLFSIDQSTGTITVAAQLDFELSNKHELAVEAEAGDERTWVVVEIRVTDVNDNPPFFLDPEPQVSIVEEDKRDLPRSLVKVDAADHDRMDHQGLLYTVRGDGVDGYTPSQAYFAINSKTGELHLLRALDRDPPHGRKVWRVRVQVRDGQALWSRQGGGEYQESFIRQPRASKGTRSGVDEILEGTLFKEPAASWKYGDISNVMRRAFREEHTNSRRDHRPRRTGGKTARRLAAEGRSTSGISRSSWRYVHSHAHRARLAHMAGGEDEEHSHVRLGDSFHPDDGASRETRRQEAEHVGLKRDKKVGRSTRHGIRGSSRGANKLAHYNDPNIDVESRPLSETVNSDSLGIDKSWKIEVENHVPNTDDNENRNIVVKNPHDSTFHDYMNVDSDLREPLNVHYSDLYKSLSLNSSSQHGPEMIEINSLYENADMAQKSLSDIPGLYELVRGAFTDNISCQFPAENRTRVKIQEEKREGPMGMAGRVVHVVETMVMVVVQDINDNPPVFPNTTMYGEVQENGPIDLSVCVVSAWDADDPLEGTNARVTYSIEKNVIHELSNEAIFTIHPHTGLVRTALCCLDRETTPEYRIQVAAVDGGGLKGTGTVVVRLTDVNDNAPRLTQRMWQVEVNETWGKGPPDETTLLEITAEDPDTANYFFYRIVEASGWGWQHFGMRAEGGVGCLYAIQTLDYEDDAHRRGFKFMVQVTDRGPGGWDDPRHLDTAWVSVTLRDLNDNPPSFPREHTHVTVQEDIAPGSLLASLRAHDPDMDGREGVDYRVEGGWGSLSVDSEGSIHLWRHLDREALDGSVGVAEVIGVDRGRPPLTSTATLTITVTDVNDCPPSLLPPTTAHVVENSQPSLLATLTATDKDVWALGHGPPFNFSMADTNPLFVLENIDLHFSPHLDSGRGGAEMWTTGSLDREEHKQLEVQVRIADAGGISAIQVFTVIVDDINDNRMKPASKAVHLWKTRGGGSDAPLGRVYVDDPDDWDTDDKVFEWVGAPHPLFSLNRNTGAIFASSQVREGRYELRFSVSDSHWHQKDISANVTVIVKLIPPLAVTHSTPLTLTPVTPTALARGWTSKHGGGVLGRLVLGVRRALKGIADNIDIVSVHGTSPPYLSPGPPIVYHDHQQQGGSIISQAPSACVWMSAREPSGNFMDPVKLQGLLQLHSSELEASVNLRVRTGILDSHPEESHDSVRSEEFSAESLASTTLPLQVVDSNSTSLVTPRLVHSNPCQAHEPEPCTPSSCLNGGRCVWTDNGNRCVCPGRSEGSSCKILARSFKGSGWAWVRPLVNCLPTTISLRVLTRRPHALLLYSGPLATYPRSSDTPATPLLALQLWHGRPQLLLEDGVRAQKLEVSASVHDGRWHTIHVHLDSNRAVLMVDLCGHQRQGEPHDSQCVKRVRLYSGHALLGSYPLQIGGLAHRRPVPEDHGWQESPTSRSLDGCLSHLRLNGQLVDLGSPPYSHGSSGGCLPQEEACVNRTGGCGMRGRCEGGLEDPKCLCDPGWTGADCALPTAPATLGPSSYMKVAMSLRPTPNLLGIQFRLRSRGARDGLLLQVSADDQADLSLHLRAGMACASLSEGGRMVRAACVEGRPVGDGAWHTIRTERHGHNLLVSIDDGDAWRRNESLVTMEEGVDGKGWRPSAARSRTKEDPERKEGVTVKLVTVQENLKDTCIDDLRISGHQLPLPPAINLSSWGEVTALHRIRPGCPAAAPCINTTCAAPLSCFSAWGQPTCSCGPGRQLVGSTCQDVDECLWQPCLHGGACVNMRPGFLCECGPGFTGDYCQWARPESQRHSALAPGVIVALILSLVFVVAAGLILGIQIRRHLTKRTKRGRKESPEVTSSYESGGGNFAEVKLKMGEKEAEMTDVTQGEQQPTVECLSLTVESEGKTKIFHKAEVLHACGVAAEPLPARDDLRAYAYEGDGSSSGSLSSAFSGLRGEQVDEVATKQLVPYFLDVVDLIKNLPEATRSPTLHSRSKKEDPRGASRAPASPAALHPLASDIASCEEMTPTVPPPPPFMTKASGEESEESSKPPDTESGLFTKISCGSDSDPRTRSESVSRSRVTW